MARFSRQQDYRIGRALAVATVLVVVGAWLFPWGWLRIFGRDLRLETGRPERAREAWIRLIPADTGSLAGNDDLVRTRITLRIVSPSPDQKVESARHVWTFDPTTAWRPLSGSASPIAPTTTDSLLLHAEFLHSLRLGNMAAVFALLDTTQAGRAREQLAETDDWVHMYLAPRWEAEGRSARIADIYWRAVGEVEAEGSQ